MYDLVILGDSISSGYGVSIQNNWVNLMLSSKPCSYKHLNLSAQGATSSDGLTTIMKFFSKHNTHHLLLELGGNDALRGNALTMLSSNLNEIITLAEENNTKVLLIGVDLPPNYGNFFRKRFQNTYEHIANRHDIPLIQLDFPQNPNLLQDNGIHPNTKGHQLIADSISPMVSAKLCNLRV